MQQSVKALPKTFGWFSNHLALWLVVSLPLTVDR